MALHTDFSLRTTLFDVPLTDWWGFCRRSYVLSGDSLKLPDVILLAAAEPEVLGPALLVVRVSLIMAAQAGRSVVFVTGNAKKLEEVRYLKTFVTYINYYLRIYHRGAFTDSARQTVSTICSPIQKSVVSH